MTNWLILALLVIAVSAYLRLSLLTWTIALGIATLLYQIIFETGYLTILFSWAIYLAIVLPLNLKHVRRRFMSYPAYHAMKSVMPRISQTEQEALDAGDVWIEGEFFKGKPDFDQVRRMPKPKLTEEEQAFLDGPTEKLCSMMNDWDITHVNSDLTAKTWAFIKKNGFLAMIIPKEYGGLGYSALLHSEVVCKLSSRSVSGAVSVMVPNSLGPAKLIMTYGTDEQKQHYLPRLASGEDLPCFALTGPEAGSDAGAMPDSGVVCHGTFDGEENVLGIRLSWEKRYITLAPVATLLGIAFKLYDPDHLLGDKEDIGITLALVRSDLEGVETGKRHFPANQGFLNGPTRGKDVFIPLDWIIGGEKYAGKGWSMLMECLTDGRAISLPALSTSAGKLITKYTGAYSRIRKQFRTPIGYFEGIEEALARIAGHSYAMEAARLLVLSGLDNGAMPSVISGVVKQQLTERMRIIVNNAMDIHGGHAICMGPHNFLGRIYQALPISITVEGANILTRSMIIFGQGAMRSHPYILKEVEAINNPDTRQGKKDFDNTLFAHVGFVISNLVRSFWLGISFTKFASAPGNHVTRYYYRQLLRMSACFALVTDFCLLMLGGALKRKEKISGRLADVISNLYIISACLKYYEDQGQLDEDAPFLQWACDDALYNIQNALKGVLKNLPVPYIGAVLNFIIFPLTKPYQQPDDTLCQKVTRLMLKPSNTVERLSNGIYITDDPDDATGRIEHAHRLVLQTSHIERKLRSNQKAGELPVTGTDIYALAHEKGIIDDDELKLIEETRAAVHNAIMVDEFSNKGWKPEKLK